MPTASPLEWPPGWPRANVRESANFKTTLVQALKFLEDEVRRLGGKSLVISSNYTLGRSNPPDCGVAVYFQYQGISAAIPCDRWNKIEHNLHAIAKTIEAMRGIERWGAKHMIKAAFTGFAALPAPGQTTGRSWRVVLGAAESDTPDQIKAKYRRLASEKHPDREGGSQDAMSELNWAWAQAQQALAAH